MTSQPAEPGADPAKTVTPIPILPLVPEPLHLDAPLPLPTLDRATSVSSPVPPPKPESAMEQDIRKIEEDYVTARRDLLGHDLWPNGDPVGLSLSGGGIRSATFSLGVLKGLSRLGLIRKIDYLSTVSGGGYAGAFYCSLFVPTDARGKTEDSSHRMPPTPEDVAFRDDPDPLRHPRGKAGLDHLRQNGRYLLPGAAGDLYRLITIWLRNWLAIHLVIGVSAVAFFLFMKIIQVLLIDWLGSLEVWLADIGLTEWIWPMQWLYGQQAGPVLLSPFWPLAALTLFIWSAFNWSFWLTRTERISSFPLIRLLGGGTLGTVVIVLMCGRFLFTDVPAAMAAILGLVGVGGVSAILFFLIYEAVYEEVDRSVFRVVVTRLSASFTGKRQAWDADYRKWNASENANTREQENIIRTKLTAAAAFWLAVTGLLAVLAIIDTAGATFYEWAREDSSAGGAQLTGVGAGLAGLVQGLRWIVEWLQKRSIKSTTLRRFGNIVAAAVGLLLALAIAIFWATVSHYIAWEGYPVGVTGEDMPSGNLMTAGFGRLIGLSLCLFLIAWGFGVSFGFLNLSSFSSFYASRLRRAYLGASNPRRTEHNLPADMDERADDVALQDYYNVPQPQLREAQENGGPLPVEPAADKPEATGAPLHLINCTINETKGKDSGLVQRDRKGRPLTLSPAGHLYPLDGQGGERERVPFSLTRSLPLSTWMGISGAAFSTALGKQTSLGFSLLAGIANLRLGYWWLPARLTLDYSFKPWQWVQRYLIAEMRAAFDVKEGNRLYLTDGGHFENTGVYELVRRRVPFIIACDNGADPDYTFTDVVNLMRKLRIDLNAELDFLPRAYLDRLFPKPSPQRVIFGELSDLVRYSEKKRGWGPYAALGRIRVRNADGALEYLGTLILVKPRLAGMELADLLDYHRANDSFPQQSTADQFFDEAQWESYFNLGERITQLIFSLPADSAPKKGGEETGAEAGEKETAPWNPSALLRIDPAVHDWIALDWPVADTGDKDDKGRCCCCKCSCTCGDETKGASEG